MSGFISLKMPPRWNLRACVDSAGRRVFWGRDAGMSVCLSCGRFGAGAGKWRKRPRAVYRADAAGRWSASYDSELCAGERLRLAGCSSGWGVGASISGGGVIRFYCGVLRSITPVFFPLSGKKKRLAMCCVPIPAWVGIAFCAFSSVSMVIGLCWLTLGLRVFCRRFRRSTRGVRLYEKERRLALAFLLIWSVIRCDTAGSTLGLRQGDIVSLDSLHLIRGVGAFYAASVVRVRRRQSCASIS